ncbi:MAG: hypothetical protein HY769_08415 [Candidatus Stahlbacteria bacterium]|nr:hypothetical protein [Candidatus Stahlbacteria bacterium]
MKGMLERSPAEYGINSNPVFAGAETIDKTHPVDYLLREEILSSVWCPGCGIGTVVNAFVETLKKTSGQGTRSYPVDKICIVSGIGCTGKVADYLKLNSINATDGNAIHSAIKFKSENPDVKVVVFLNDVDFIAFGIDGFIEACQKDIVVIHINNFIYIITERFRTTL